MKAFSKEGNRIYSYIEERVLPTVEVRSLVRGHEEEIIFSKNGIIFILAGKIRFIFRDHPEKTISEDEFFFVPTGGILRFRVLEETRVTIIRLNVSVNLFKVYSVEELYTVRDNRQEEEFRREICALKINRPLRHFIHGLNEIAHNGLNYQEYFDIKARELLILLKAFYPAEDLKMFFSLILSPDTVFSEYVRANCHRYRTIEELASRMNITPKHFSKIFTRVFGMPPGRWLNREKAKMIHYELLSGTKPLKQIAHEYGFSSQSQLNRFCKRELKGNPGEIRNGKEMGKKDNR